MISILVKRYNVEYQTTSNLAYYTNLSYLKKRLRTMIKNGDANDLVHIETIFVDDLVFHIFESFE